jgi:hypothetical protein
MSWRRAPVIISIAGKRILLDVVFGRRFEPLALL